MACQTFAPSAPVLDWSLLCSLYSIDERGSGMGGSMKNHRTIDLRILVAKKLYQNSLALVAIHFTQIKAQLDN